MVIWPVDRRIRRANSQSLRGGLVLLSSLAGKAIVHEVDLNPIHLLTAHLEPASEEDCGNCGTEKKNPERRRLPAEHGSAVSTSLSACNIPDVRIERRGLPHIIKLNLVGQ